ncbi:MAG TPA: hypothetical protein V6D11_11300 [Waterburya sp.]|jgi:hypothetical protein
MYTVTSRIGYNRIVALIFGYNNVVARIFECNKNKEQSKDKYYDIYPASDLDLVDEAIERVLKRYAKTN